MGVSGYCECGGVECMKGCQKTSLLRRPGLGRDGISVNRCKCPSCSSARLYNDDHQSHSLCLRCYVGTLETRQYASKTSTVNWEWQ